MKQTKKAIEQAYTELVEQHKNRYKSKTTSEDMVLRLMLDNVEKIWWWSWEVNHQTNSKSEYISHRGCARLSDLAIYSPQLVEDRQIGRFKVYRLHTENMKLIKARLK